MFYFANTFVHFFDNGKFKIYDENSKWKVIILIYVFKFYKWILNYKNNIFFNFLVLTTFLTSQLKVKIK